MRKVPVPLLLVLFCAYSHSQTGLRMTMVSRGETSGRPQVAPPIDTSSTIYVSGPNHRVERVQEYYRGKLWHIAHIARCAEHVDYDVNLDTHEFIESPTATRKHEDKPARTGAANVIFDVTTVDTGETKKLFGHTAHHYVTTTKQTESAELGGKPSETTEDVWLLDIPDALMCPPGRHRLRGVIGGVVGTGGGSGGSSQIPQIRPEFRYHGPDPQGLAAFTKRTTVSHEKYVYGEAYNVTSTFTTEILDLKEEQVNPALFEVPKGFIKVKNFTPPGK